MFEDKKHAFWQALVVTVLFFLTGLVLGIYLEQLRADSTNVIFYNSENSLYDSFALSKLADSSNVSCGNLEESVITFADKIYWESKNLEEFDSANKLTESMKILHKKYDLLRTLLWMNEMSVEKKCGNLNSVVYLYSYDTNDLAQKANQAVWGKLLQDLKNAKGNGIILIPIASDQNLSSLDYLTRDYSIKKYPAVIINEKIILYEPTTVADIEKLLNK